MILKGRSSAILVASVAAMAFAACLVLQLLPGCSISQENPGLSGSVREPALPYAANSRLEVSLLDWSGFSEFWESCEREDAEYVGSDGCGYRLQADAVPGKGVGRSWILDGAEALSEDDSWQIAVIDCSTGSVSFWGAGEKVASGLGSVDAGLLSGGDLRGIGGGKWAFFDNYPRPIKEVQRETLDYVSDHEEGVNWLLADYSRGGELVRGRIVREADADLMDALIVMYGADEIGGA